MQRATDDRRPEIEGAEGHVDILQVRFPRVRQEQAVAFLLGRLGTPPATAVCFPDMSTLNTAEVRPSVKRLLQHRLITLNDGAGLALVARLRGRGFPDNLNGTDLCPKLLTGAPAGTRVFLLGAQPDVVHAARRSLAQAYPHIDFVGCSDGYLDARREGDVVAELRSLRPDIVFVAMGNPLQLEFIDRHVDDAELPTTMWLAVGGLLDYYGGDLVRAPRWMVRARLEWFNIVVRQPYKAKRYLIGIPLFLARSLIAQARRRHDMTETTAPTNRRDR